MDKEILEKNLKKICVTGGIGSGKTSFIKKVVDQKNFNNKLFNLELCDIPSSDEKKDTKKNYYNDMDGAFVLVDASSLQSFSDAVLWKKDIDAKCAVPTILLVNKIDLLDEFVEQNMYNDFYSKCGFVKWIAICTKENIGLDEAIDEMCKLIDNQTILTRGTTFLDKFINIFKNKNSNNNCLLDEIDNFVEKIYFKINYFFTDLFAKKQSGTYNIKLLYAFVYRDILDILTKTGIDADSKVIDLKAVLLRLETSYYDNEIDSFDVDVEFDFQPIIYNLSALLLNNTMTSNEKISLIYNEIFMFKNECNNKNN